MRQDLSVGLQGMEVEGGGTSRGKWRDYFVNVQCLKKLAGVNKKARTS